MNRKQKKLRVLITVCLILAIITALVSAELIYSNYALTVSRYTVRSEKAEGGFRVVFISDLHGREFGKDDRRLLKKIALEEPDIIALVGDIIDRDSDEKEVESVCAFISEAVKLAPVYYGLGNREKSYISENGSEILDRLSEAGAMVLEGEYADVEINGVPVRIGGYEGYYRTPHLNSRDPEQQALDREFFSAFEKTDRFKLLLNHIPTNWLDWGYRDSYPVDLVLSGHYHGGIVRIPFIDKGLYAPYVGYYPPYTKGCFEGEKATCVLSTGLAGANGIPRVFNPPEIVVVEVVPAE